MLRAGREGDLLPCAGLGELRVPVAVSTELWAELHARMRAFIARRAGDDAADDLAQEVLLRLHRNLPRLREQERLDAFAYRIARNVIVDHHRSAARRHERSEDDIERVAERLADEAEGDDPRSELSRCLRPLLARLPDAHRQALELTDLGELTQAQAAARLGLSVPGMKSRVQRARAEVGDLLAACCAVRLDAARQIDAVERVGPCACRRSAV